MIDLGPFAPDPLLNVVRTTRGDALLGRKSTTDEQRAEALEWMRERVNTGNNREARATIRWPDREPTIIVATFSIEHLNGLTVRVLDRFEEQSATGATLSTGPADRMAALQPEVAELKRTGELT